MCTRRRAVGPHAFACFMNEQSPPAPRGQWTSVRGRPATCGTIQSAMPSKYRAKSSLETPRSGKIGRSGCDIAMPATTGRSAGRFAGCAPLPRLSRARGPISLVAVATGHLLFGCYSFIDLLGSANVIHFREAPARLAFASALAPLRRAKSLLPDDRDLVLVVRLPAAVVVAIFSPSVA